MSEKQKRVFLDGIRFPEDKYKFFPIEEWKIVRSLDKFKESIKKEVPDFISFAHDLFYEQIDYYLMHHQFSNKEIDYSKHPFNNGKTGLDCVKWLVEYCKDNNLKMPKCVCHDGNHIGRKNIMAVINNAKENCK